MRCRCLKANVLIALFAISCLGLVFGFWQLEGLRADVPTGEGGPAKRQLAQISGDPNEPRRHFRERDSLELTPVQAARVYKAVQPDLLAGYAGSGDLTAAEFSAWPRFNTTPYRSATHGLRYVNNYANEIARDYGLYEKAGTLPPGSIIAKDSFSVTIDGQRQTGPLFIMEKMEAGFNYVSGDWRYTMITPDGEVFGTTKGANSERVKYCIGCHLVRERNDHLYFVPVRLRVFP